MLAELQVYTMRGNKIKFLVILVFMNYNAECLKVTDGAITEDRLVLLGGYFSVHQGHNDTCGKIDDSGVYLAEAMRYAIENVNKRKDLYVAGQLGYRIVDTCSSAAKLRKDMPKMYLKKNVAGIVGPATTDEAIYASILYGILGTGVVSYSATGIDLQDRKKHPFLYRTVPSDHVQILALLDILKHYNWTYVSTVNSDGTFGQRGMDVLISKFAENGICSSSRNVLPANPTRSDYAAVIKNIENDVNAKVVVLFTTAKDTNGLFRAAGSKTRVTWLSSSAWGADMETVRGVSEAAKGALILNYASINSQGFLEHFKSLKLKNNRYGWFEEFWNKTFNCKKKHCTGDEDLAKSDFYGKYAAAKAVIDAVNAFAYSIDCALAINCVINNITKQSCVSTISNKSIKNKVKLPFRYVVAGGLSGRRVCDPLPLKPLPFGNDGSLHRDIEIINFDGITYNTIGNWKKQNRTLKIDEHKITWFDGKSNITKSICSRPCKMGERKVLSKTKECCFTCHPCKINEILVNNSCQRCAQFQLSNENRTSCIQLEKLRVDITHFLSVIVLVESSVGIILNTIVLTLFIKHKNSKVVKASSRELSFFMLAGLYLCFISPCIFLLNPTVVRCGLRRFIFGLSLTACYTPLMLKTNRIYRIFKAARVMVSMPYLVSPASQILICFGLLALQLLLSIMWVVGDPPVVSHVLITEYKMVADLCAADILTIAINLVPCFCMLAASTVYAFKSRKFPKNYNEAFNIGVTMYISCVLWAIFIPLLLLVKVESKNPFSQIFVIANFSNIIGLVSLAGLFGPKARRLILHGDEDEKGVMYSTADRSIENGITIDLEVNERLNDDVTLKEDVQCKCMAEKERNCQENDFEMSKDL